MVPARGPQQRLQGVVIRSSLALHLVNDAVIGELVEVRPRGLLIAVRSNPNVHIATAQGGLVDVADVQQMAGVGSNVTNLHHDIRAETLLDVQVVAIGIRGPKVLIHRKEVGDTGACNGFCQRSENQLARAPDGYTRLGIRTGHRVGPGRIVLNSKGATVHRAAQIQEGHHVRGVVEHSKAAADDRVRASRLVSETYPWAEAGPELLVDVGAIDARNRNSIRRGWIEGR